jgi:hypothetical protein
MSTPAPHSDFDERAVLEEAAAYCKEHPRGPAAIRHPRILRRGRKFIALLGSTLEDGIAGIGETVAAALQAFDSQYRERLGSRR